MTNEPKRRRHAGLMVLPRLRVQNANAVSSPMTWGFPSITAFTGMMVALERRLGPEAGIRFVGVGVVCHGHEAQTAPRDFRTRSFRLTRNPVAADGSTAAIVEEGRIHLEVTLVFEVRLSDDHLEDSFREAWAGRIADAVAGMRLAGGSILPSSSAGVPSRRKPWMELLQPPDAEKERKDQFRRLARRCLPGFVLVSRQALLEQRLEELKAERPNATALDALLDLSCLKRRAEAPEEGTSASTVEWVYEARRGWCVPIPVGYAALSDLHPPGAVSGARDRHTPFRFVETVWSMGQWISPHRLNDVEDLLWRSAPPTPQGLYRCTNRYQAALPAEMDLADDLFDN